MSRPKRRPIGPPQTPLSETPGPFRKEEQQDFRKAALTPTQRLSDSQQAHIASLKEQIRALNRDIARRDKRQDEIEDQNRRLQADLDRLSPELAELQQARRVAGWLGTLTTLMMFVGSLLISHAGTLPDGEPKSWYRALGWSVSGCGVLFTVLVLAFGWPPKRRASPGEPSAGPTLSSGN